MKILKSVSAMTFAALVDSCHPVAAGDAAAVRQYNEDYKFSYALYKEIEVVVSTVRFPCSPGRSANLKIGFHRDWIDQFLGNRVFRSQYVGRSKIMSADQKEAFRNFYIAGCSGQMAIPVDYRLIPEKEHE